MTFRRFTAILLGVLLQVSVFGGISFAANTDTVRHATTCGCCDLVDQCPCASSTDDQKPPLPAIPSSKDTKPSFVDHSEPEVTGNETRAGPLSEQICSASFKGFSGYAGVSISVSYCRFTI